MRSRRSSLSGSSIASALLVGLGAALLAACSPHDSSTPQESTASTGSGRVGAPNVTARDEAGAPKFLWADRTTATSAIAGDLQTIARDHLSRHAEVLGLSQKLVSGAQIANVHEIPGGGSITSFKQKVNGIEVFRTHANVIMDKTNNLVAIAGNLRPGVEVPSKAGHFTITPEQAFVRAYADRFGVTLSSGAVTDLGADADGEYHAYRITTPDGAPTIVDTAKVRKIYTPVKSALVASYHVEFIGRAPASKTNDAWLYAIAGDNGRTLLKSSLTANEKFTYRVFTSADQHNIPTDGPLKDQTPLPATATPTNTTEPAFILPGLVTVDSFNKTMDPWLPATATVTTGNNVDAYTDRNSQTNGTGDGFDPTDYRADLTAPLTFDRTYNTAAQPNVSIDQMKASVTQIFYINNWLHDYWYDSGFDEKSGNAQMSNLGRGGKEGDPLHAEGQDGADVGLADNANMSSMSDGTSPRMQMYVWGLPNPMIVSTPPITFGNKFSIASFSPGEFDVTGNAKQANPPIACTDATTGACTGTFGKIAVIDRGTCSFVIKAKACQDNGAKGIIVVNNAAGMGPPGMGGMDATITVPVMGVSLEDGALIKALVTGTSPTLHITNKTFFRDGTIDNTVIAHEWGHYLHHRLVDCGGVCPPDPQGLTCSCGAMSEGWADFDALMMVIKAGDVLDGTAFPLATYASGAFTSPSYYGIRRAPYSSELTKNAFTFADIRASQKLPTTAPFTGTSGPGFNNEPHAAGEVWAETLFEGYTNLLRDTQGAAPRLTFDEAKRRMANYVVAGMKATPVEPTFVEQRDAILAAIFAADAADFAAVSKGFAKRGLGVGAIAPPATSLSLDEAMEDFSDSGNLAYVDATIDDAVRSCDRDGYLDADEKGDATIRVRNAGWVNLKDTSVTVTTTAAGVTFGNGGVGTVASVDPFGVAKVRIPIAFDPAGAKMEFVPITVTLANPDSFSKSVTGSIQPRANFDIKPTSAKTDDVESPVTAWTIAHGIPDTATSWARAAKLDADGKPVSPPDFAWLGADLGTGPADEMLVSPSMTVSATEPFTVAFSHKYGFENGPASAMAPTVSYFDGGVIEISIDNGTTWVDISTYADPGYTQTIFTNSAPGAPDPKIDNPLAGRMAYAGDLTTVTPVTLDLGTKVAGKTVKIRFRLGSDPATGAAGWQIDNLAFTGITNTPFPSLIDDASTCMGVPVVVPGPAQTVLSGAKVKLDASGSTSPTKAPITFQWEELDGPDVKLDDPTAAATTGFTAPDVTAPTKLLFRVTVADDHQAASDTVEITVVPQLDGGATGGEGGTNNGNPGDPAPKSDDGCGCSTVGASNGTGLGALGAMLAGAVAVIFRSRRRKQG